MNKQALVFLAVILPTPALANQNTPEMIIFGSLGMALIAGFAIFYSFQSNEGAVDLDNFDYANEETLQPKLSLMLPENGIFSLSVIRQSGNVERVTENLSLYDVTAKILYTMQKAKIDTLSLNQTDNLLRLYRTSHNARGKQEGKRIGGFDILQTGEGLTETGVDNKMLAAEMINLNPQSEAEKAIIKAFLQAAEQAPDNAPEELIRSFDADTGEGNDDFHHHAIVLMLLYADTVLLGRAKMTSKVREQFKSSEIIWQQQLGNDQSVNYVMGIHGFGSTTPKDVKEAFLQYWQLCENKIGSDHLSLGTGELMNTRRPKILDHKF